MSNVVQPGKPQPTGTPGRRVAVPAAASKGKGKEVRGGLLLLGLLLIVIAGGGFWFILRELDTRQEYLVTARTVERWDIVGPGDFAVVSANLGPVEGVPPEFVDLLVGKWATGRIPAGTLVAPGMFDTPPLSSEESSGKILMQLTLPAGEAPGGSLAEGDRIALFGAAPAGDTLDGAPAEQQVSLIGVLELPSIEGDTITYLVTPTEARLLRDIVGRYNVAQNRYMWKIGFGVTVEELVDGTR